MKKTLRWLLPCALIACLCGCIIPAQAQDSDNPAAQSDREIVSIGHASILPAGQSAEDVVSVFGSTTADGDVSDSAVAVLGDLTVNGHVSQEAVAVLGDVYINGKVDGDVTAVLGSVTLGPQAIINGQVTEVLGTLNQSPSAVVQGGTVHVLTGVIGSVAGLHAWIERCFLYGRPLAPTLDIAWAWWLALGTLLFYLLLAAVFREALTHCVQTLDRHPGPSLLATIIVVLLVPVVMLALVITVVGIAVIPLFWIALFCAGIFGRVVAIAWLGSRCLRLASTGASQTVLEVLVGGLLVLALYMVPVLGSFVYMLVGVFGFGAVVYTLLLATRPAPGAPGARPKATADPSASGSSELGASAASAAATPAPEMRMGADTASGPQIPPPGTGGGAAMPPSGGAAAAHATPELLDVATLPRAGFWIRMLALLIDLILVGVALSWVHHGGSGMLLLLATYGAIMWKLKGTTVGGIVCDLKVVRIGGGPLDWGTAIVRALGCFLSLVVAGLGFIWIAVDREHQAWHDKIAGTVVVRVPKGVGLV
ncbi:MAG TPA: RDD family protein [Steroidobacteraceae bacterium]|nr:RDD family protein [Steroidobacteraceae bacterium]